MSINRLTIFTLYSTVFITGAAVLIIEVSAVRILTPIFGSSIYVLSSVLTTVLLALSLGYFVGGRIADKKPYPLPLYLIITSGGLILLLLQIITLTIAETLGPISSYIIGPLILAFTLFFLPAFLLGMDSPYVIKLLTQSVPQSESGKYVGTTFFWSTIGSIVGSISSGFWLIPFLGITNTLTLTSIVLIILGLVAPLLLTRFKSTDPLQKGGAIWYKRAIILSLFVFCVVMVFQLSARKPPYIIYSTDGYYSNIQIEEQMVNGLTRRQLKRDTNFSSAINLENHDHIFDYAKFINLYEELKPNPEKILVLGGGAYSIPRNIVSTDSEVAIDVVEIEPSLFELAQKYFDLTDISQITNYPMDARVFLKQTANKYDVVLMDTFGTAYHIPHHLATQEFFTTLKSRMSPNAILMINYVGTYDTEEDSFTYALTQTIQSVFPQVTAYIMNRENPSHIQNIVYMIRNGNDSLTLSDDTVLPNMRNGINIVNELEVDLSPFIAQNPEHILTDDKAPVEYLMAKQIYKYLNSENNPIEFP